MRDGMMKSDLLIRGGRVVDPASNRDQLIDLLIKGGKIVQIESGIRSEGVSVLDVGGLVVAPGLIDVHVHLREPGFEYKETIATGTRAAAAGGFSRIVAMPNTEPPMDSSKHLNNFMKKVRETAVVRTHPIACITEGRAGEKIAPLSDLSASGAVAFSDDGDPVEDEQIMRTALHLAAELDKPVFPHEEVKRLTSGGCMHEGAISSHLGVKGMPSAGEEEMIDRDIRLVRETGGPLHVAHISTAGSVELLRAAKKEHLPVTCEVLPHHFVLTDEDVAKQGTAAKMSPPLRSRADIEAIIGGLVDGTIDLISTDHAPHTTTEKALPLPKAPFGIVGLETALALTLTYLVRPGILDLKAALEKWTWNAARALRLRGGRLSLGEPGDVTIFDPDEEWTVDPRNFNSKSANTPFGGYRLTGRAVATVVGGNPVFTRLG